MTLYPLPDGTTTTEAQRIERRVKQLQTPYRRRASDRECGKVADPRRNGQRYLGESCHELAGHSGTCVLLDAHGERSGVFYTIAVQAEMGHSEAQVQTVGEAQ